MMKPVAMTLAGAFVAFAPQAHAQEMTMDVGPVGYQAGAAAVQVRVNNMSSVTYRDLRFACDFRSAGAVLATATFTLPVLEAQGSQIVTVQANTGAEPVYQVACRGLF
jgi:hypothetical protein